MRKESPHEENGTTRRAWSCPAHLQDGWAGTSFQRRGAGLATRTSGGEALEQEEHRETLGYDNPGGEGGCAGGGQGIHLLVETERGRIRACLGPSWYIDHLDFKLTVGDFVRVTGSRTERAGRPVLVACRITCGDKTVELRDEEGRPVWSGWRRAPTEASCRRCVIQGVVRDASGASVPGASLFLEPSHQSVETEASGFFCFSEVEGPQCNALVVTAAGFEEQRISPVPGFSTPACRDPFRSTRIQKSL